MFVVGVNFGAYKSEYSIISSALSTTNCVATIVKVAHDKFGIENVSMSTIRAMGITDIKANITLKYSKAVEVVGRIVLRWIAGSRVSLFPFDLLVWS
jgi:glyceraldehyde-3-phosphate dehydrogenase/erythrose-4-phosphate dehydrogenase